MKIVVSYAVVYLVVFLFGLLPLHGGGVAMHHTLDVGNLNASGQLDSSLMAIAINPSILKKIDQKKNFKNDGAYRDLLQNTLDQANKLVPNVMEKNTGTNYTVSVCVADSKVYFWNMLYDRDVIGWISIQELTESRATPSKMTVWIVPRLRKDTTFVKKWREGVKQQNVLSMVAVTKLALDIDINHLENNDAKQLCGTVKLGDENHSVKICTSGNILQAEVMHLPAESTDSPGKPAMREAELLNKMPIILPFWPPE